MALYLRRFPFDIAKWRLWKWAKPASQQLGGPLLPPRVISTKYQFRMLIDPNDHLGREMFLWGEYEAECSRVFRVFLKPGDHILDIGANVGYFTLLGASLVGKDGEVIAFEASPITFQHLKRNIELNQFKQINIHRQAIGRSQDRLTLYQGPLDHSGVTSLRPIKDCSASFEVEVSSLNEYLKKSLPKINFVKIDVEGAEFDVLNGMLDILRRDKPYIILELTDEYLRDFGNSAEELLALMFDLGYSCYRILDRGLTTITQWDSTLPKQFNALFSMRNISHMQW